MTSSGTMGNWSRESAGGANLTSFEGFCGNGDSEWWRFRSISNNWVGTVSDVIREYIAPNVNLALFDWPANERPSCRKRPSLLSHCSPSHTLTSLHQAAKGGDTLKWWKRHFFFDEWESEKLRQFDPEKITQRTRSHYLSLRIIQRI